MESISEILFHVEEVLLPSSLSKAPEKHQSWIFHLIEQEGKQLILLNFIFCSDDYLHRINQEYLEHDTYTDIITFDNSEETEEIEGDVFISVDRVAENADEFKTTMDRELKRVMAHGVLHLCGYSDKSETDIGKMRQKEEEALALSLKYIG